MYVLKHLALAEEEEGKKSATRPAAEPGLGGGFPTSKFLPLPSFFDLNKDLTSLGVNFLTGKLEMTPLFKRM